MEKITQFAVNNSRATLLFLACILIIGIQTFLSMPSQEDPEITIRNAQVTALFPGMPTNQVENLLAKPLEKKIKEIPEVEEIKTTISTGKVILQPKVADRYFELEPIWQDLRNKMNDMRPSLPEGTLGPIVNDDFGRVAAATIALSGDGFTMREKRDVANHLQDQISAMPSVSKVSIMGVQNECIHLKINAHRLSQYGIPFSSLIDQLSRQNIVLPGGSINVDGRTLTIEPSGNFQSIDEIRNLQVQIPGGDQVVYLQDIAVVERGYVDPPEYAAYYNDQAAVILAVSMVPRFNIEAFGTEITRKVNILQETLPLGLQLDFATYQPTLVTQSVNSAVSNLYQTVGVVLVVVIAFLGVRTGLIVSAIVPLTILMSFIIMNLWGIDLQRMSIAAIIIALGLLVDNGIVIAEDIQTRMDNGSERKAASIAAAKGLGIPLLTSSLTTLFMFLPLMMAKDVTGEYLRSLSQVIFITLLASWFLAMYATPTLCSWFLKNKSGTSSQKKHHGNNLLARSYSIGLKNLLRFRILSLLILLGLLIASLFGLSKIPKQMMPYSDRNQFLVYLDFPSGTHINETTKVTRRLTHWLADSKQNPKIESSIAYIGYGGPRFFLALSPPDPSENHAFIVINTEHVDDVDTVKQQVDNYILDQLPEARGRSKKMSLGAGEIGLVEYRIIGPDINTLYRVGRRIEDKMRTIAGSTDIGNDWGEPIYRMQVHIDQDRASRAGVTSQAIAKAMNAYLDGQAVSHYRDGDQSIPIQVQGDLSRNNLSELETLPIPSDKGAPVPLIQVAEFERIIVPSQMKRLNQTRTYTVYGKHTKRQATDFHQVLWPYIESIELDEGYQIEVGGEVESSASGNAALAENLPLALIGITVLLVLQFNSFRRPIIILLTIPLVIIGAYLGLFLGQAFFSFTAILGIFSLFGIIVNNGIVLIDRIDAERLAGKRIQPAIVDACLARMRPILMTTLTTILGLIPMALFGGAMWFPMAVCIMGGLAVGSLLTLGCVPILYSLFFRDPEVL